MYANRHSCGAEYLGETSRCFNERFRKHCVSQNNNRVGAVHVRDCGGFPEFGSIRGRYPGRRLKDTRETWLTAKIGVECISEQFVSLTKSERWVLNMYAPKYPESG